LPKAPTQNKRKRSAEQVEIEQYSLPPELQMRPFHNESDVCCVIVAFVGLAIFKETRNFFSSHKNNDKTPMLNYMKLAIGQHYTRGDGEPITSIPTNFYPIHNAGASLETQLYANQQHDAGDMYNVLVQDCESEFTTEIQKASVSVGGAGGGGGGGGGMASQYPFRAVCKIENRLQLLSHCPDCDDSNIAFPISSEAFITLRLPEGGGETTIDEMMHKAFATEVVQGVRRETCEHTTAVRTMGLRDAAPNLVFMIGRSKPSLDAHSEAAAQVDDTRVEIPIHLSIQGLMDVHAGTAASMGESWSKIQEGQRDLGYKLRAIVRHTGGIDASSGHFVIYILLESEGTDGVWYLFNDKKVYRQSVQDVFCDATFRKFSMLFYSKCVAEAEA